MRIRFLIFIVLAVTESFASITDISRLKKEFTQEGLS